MHKWLIVGLICLLPSMIYAGLIDYNVDIIAGDVKTEIVNNYDYVSIPNYEHIVEPGHPALPAKVFTFVIPADARIENVEVVNERGRYLAGDFNILPAQKPVPISCSQGNEFTLPDEQIYSLNSIYPHTTVRFVHEGNLSGYRLVSVLVTPLRYNPSTKKLHLTNHITFRIKYQNGAVPFKTITESQKKLAQKRVKALVVNKNDVEQYSPFFSKGLWQTEYFIITDQSFVNAFMPLKEWKTQKGVPAEIVTTSWIYSNYTGNDNADKIRNFIKEAADSGGIYFLLAGQCDFEHTEEYVPRRDVWCMTSGVGYYPDEDTIPCDMYFSDLDRDWDYDGDGTYGENPYDWVDLYSDVYVGRAPVKNTTQVNNFVSKVIAYEKSPSQSFIKKVILPVGNLWPGNHGNAVNDSIAALAPSGWQKSKLYEDYGLMSRYIVRDSMDQGFNLGHMVGHGNANTENYTYGVYYHGNDAGTQSNDSTNSVIILAMGCMCGALDYVHSATKDCMAERMVNTNKMCATATMMNSRYGWGYASPQGALGPSDKVSLGFFIKLFTAGAYHLGEALAAGKDHLVPWAGDNYIRWCLYEFNLFGDPEMPIWTDTTRTLVVNFSADTITATFTVNVQHSGSPVANALVTIMQDSTAHYRELTDGSGDAQFTFHGTSFQHQGYALVTVTNYSDNFLPVMDSAIVHPSVNTEELPPQGYTHFNVVVTPNPIKNTINLNLGAPINNECMIKVYDIQGSLVKSVKLNKGISEIGISTTGLSSGVYFLKADGEITVEEKIIIVK